MNATQVALPAYRLKPNNRNGSTKNVVVVSAKESFTSKIKFTTRRTYIFKEDVKSGRCSSSVARLIGQM